MVAGCCVGWALEGVPVQLLWTCLAGLVVAEVGVQKEGWDVGWGGPREVQASLRCDAGVACAAVADSCGVAGEACAGMLAVACHGAGTAAVADSAAAAGTLVVAADTVAVAAPVAAPAAMHVGEVEEAWHQGQAGSSAAAAAAATAVAGRSDLQVPGHARMAVVHAADGKAVDRAASLASHALPVAACHMAVAAAVAAAIGLDAACSACLCFDPTVAAAVEVPALPAAALLVAAPQKGS